MIARNNLQGQPNYAFKNIILDTQNRALYIDGSAVYATDKVLQLLCVLLQHPGIVVSKYDLLDFLWPQQEVSEWSLSRLVSDTRQLLGESAKDQGLIVTIRSKGFCLHQSIQVICFEGSVAEYLASATPLNPPNEIIKPGNFQQTFVLSTLAIFLILISIFSYDYYLNNHATVHANNQVTILPVKVLTGDDQDRWVEYGIMSIATKRLQRFPELQVADEGTTINSLFAIKFDAANQTENLFNRVCVSLGCKQLVAIELSLVDSGPQLQYVVYSEGTRSKTFQFQHDNILLSANMLVEHLTQYLIPEQKERLSLKDTYSDDSLVNQNYALGVSSLHHGDFKSAIVYLEMALNKNKDFYWAKTYLSDAHYRMGSYQKANSLIDEMFDETQDKLLKYHWQRMRSNIEYAGGNLSASLKYSQQALTLIEQIDDPEIKGVALMNMGTSYQATGDNNKAVAYLNQALLIFKQNKSRLREAQVLYNLGNAIWVGQQDFVQAAESYTAAADLFLSLGATSYLSFSRHALATLRMDVGRLDDAEADYLRLLDLYQELGDKEGQMLASIDLGAIQLERDDPTSALEYFETAYQAAGDSFTYVRSFAGAYKALIFLNQGEGDKVKALLEEREQFEWFDPRPKFAMTPACYAHMQGDYGNAVALAEKVKERLGNNSWTASHQAYLNAFIASLRSNTSGISNYAQTPQIQQETD